MLDFNQFYVHFKPKKKKILPNVPFKIEIRKKERFYFIVN